ncbi:MAG: hypothetical protein KF823_11420 [Xanthomonadales bacterium]|nr:hypothetical protein [Xanthomonadales bacterium]
MADWDSTLAALYAGTLQPDRLAAFGGELCALTGSSLVTLTHHDFATGHGAATVLAGAPACDGARYAREHAADNLWLQRCGHVIRTGALVHSDDHVGRAEFRATRLYEQVFRLLDRIDNALGLVALREGDEAVLLSLHRPGRMASWDGHELALLQRLAPHWVNAWALHRRLAWLEEQATTLDAALDVLPAPMILFDGAGRIGKLNEAAARLLQDGSLLHGKAGLVNARHDGAALAAAIGAACRGRPGGDGHRERARQRLILHDGDGQSAASVDIQPLPVASMAADSFVAVMFVQPVAAPAGSDGNAVLRRMFGLTQAEAALALSLRQHGQLGTAAAALGITPGSARTRLKVVFDKVGERSQAALLRVLDAVLGG